MNEPRSILVVRRDNIGDLVCTTPLLHALRERFPRAWLGVYANSYNAPILAGHPDVDEILVYRKAKHHPEIGRLALLAERLRLVRSLRARRLDCVILAAPGEQPRQRWFARLLAPRRIVEYGDGASPGNTRRYTIPVAAARGLHEVEAVFLLARAFGIEGPPPPLSLAVDPAEAMRVRAALRTAGLASASRLVGVHVSARKPSQRWPGERFVALMRRMLETAPCAFLLLWSPGSPDDPRHPGDDDKAAAIARALGTAPVLAYPTERLGALVAALDACQQVICSDGGAMHVAAALGKPVVCFFGRSDPVRWRPWGVPHRVLQAPSFDVADIGVAEAFEAWRALPAASAR